MNVLGRSSSADITLVDDRASGRHCEIAKTPNGYVVRDLGSSNGTLVNATKLSSPTVLRDGDLVQIGFTVFKFQSLVSPRVERMDAPAPQVMGPGMGMGGVPHMMGMGGMGSMPVTGVPMGGSVVVNTAPAQAQEEEMNLEEMVGNVRRVADFFLPYKKLIAAGAALGLVGGLALAVLLPPSAKATFEMNIMTGGATGDGGGIATNRAQAAKSNFKSSTLIRRTLEGLKQGDTSEDRIAVLQKNLNFETTTPNFGIPPPVQNFVGDFTARTEDDAQLFLDTHLKTFIESEVEKTTKVISTKIAYLTDELVKAEATLKASDEELKEFKKKYLASLPENAAKSQEFVFDLQKTESELSSAVEQLKLEIQSASTGGSGRKAREIKAVQEEIAELKSQGLGENHPDVVAIRQRLARIEAAPDDGPSGRSGEKSLGQLKAELSAKTGQLEATRKQLEAVQTAQAALPDFEARYNDLTRSYTSSKTLYDQHTQNKQQLEYQLGFEKTAAEARFEVVVPPRVEKQSAVKAYGKKIIAGLVGGVGLGFALAAFLQILKIWRRT